MRSVEHLFLQFISKACEYQVKFKFYEGIITVSIANGIIKVQDTYNNIETIYDSSNYGDTFDDIFLYYAECEEYKNAEYDYMVCEKSYNKIIKLIGGFRYENS